MSPCIQTRGTTNLSSFPRVCGRSLENVSTLHPIVYQGTALTVLGRPAAIHEGSSCLSSSLAGEWEVARRSTDSRDFPERRSGLCEAGPLVFFLCSHFLNIERPWGDLTISCACTSAGESAGRTPDDCGMARDEPAGTISSSWVSADNAGDSDSSNINTEARGE